MTAMLPRDAMPDDSDELLDLLDETGEPLARGKPRADVHRDGDWHRAFHLWVVRPDGRVLLQRRSKRKDLEPNKVDVSVAGHYRFGEALLDVVREAEEEIGLIVRPGDLAYLTTVRSERVYEGAIDREFQEVYACRDDRPLPEFPMDCAEVAVLYEVGIDRLIALVRGDARSLPAEGYDCQDRVNNALLVDDDLIAQAREQTAQALELVQAWAAGEAEG
jgi:isopentenyldiphosphate isomerase